MKKERVRISAQQRDILRLYYADSSNRELADMLGCSKGWVDRAGRALGLRKSAEYRRQWYWEAARMAARANRRRCKHPEVRAVIGTYYRRALAGESVASMAKDAGIGRNALYCLLHRHCPPIGRSASHIRLHALHRDIGDVCRRHAAGESYESLGREYGCSGTHVKKCITDELMKQTHRI